MRSMAASEVHWGLNIGSMTHMTCLYVTEHFLGDVAALHYIDLGDQQRPFHILLAGRYAPCETTLILTFITRSVVSKGIVQALDLSCTSIA